MTDNEIIKALECCLDASPLTCKICPLFNVKNSTMVCSKSLTKFAIDLITRQRAEIEQWKEEANKYQNIWLMAVDGIETAKSEAIQEFAEMLNDRIINFPSAYPVENATLYFLNGSSHRQLEILEIIDNTVKEMVGEDK